MKQKIKLLGIVFDTKLHWNDHIEYLITRCKKCVNLIRRLSGTRWGADREILIGIYRSLIESRILYAGTVYSSVRPSKIKRLESLQLTALRLATGAFRTSPATSVLCDASIMPLHLKLGIQTIRYAANIKSLPHHPNAYLFSDQNDYISRPSTTRPAKIRSVEFANKYEIRLENILHNTPLSMELWIRPSFTLNISLTTYIRHETPNPMYMSAFAREMSNLTNYLIIYMLEKCQTSQMI
nr:unnamed protein product [Callosobruchus analis]